MRFPNSCLKVEARDVGFLAGLLRNKNEDSSVRSIAARALGMIRNKSSIEMLKVMTETAIEIMGIDKSSREILSKFLDSKYMWVIYGYLCSKTVCSYGLELDRLKTCR